MKDLALALREQFGRETEITPLIAEDRMGRRIHGVDLTKDCLLYTSDAADE